MAAFTKKVKPLPTTSAIPIGVIAHHGIQKQSEVAKRKDIPQGLWEKCKNCNELIFSSRKEENLQVCPKCGYHYPMTALERIDLLTDLGSFSVDTLKFEGVSSYVDKLRANHEKTGLRDAVISGVTTINFIPYVLAVMDFRFLGASMGAVVGEKITRAIETATAKRLPLVIVTASGGARMYEGLISLMQMAKTSGALYRHKEAGLPYIVILTHPTTAGVTASFASLGDLILAEPGAMVGFAGRRVIEATTQAQLPDGFQTSEFLLQKGFVDRIIERKNLRAELTLCLEYFTKRCKVNKAGKSSRKQKTA